MAEIHAPLLKVENLKVYFPIAQAGLFSKPVQLKAVDGVTFDVGQGETLGIVGESGCGKSTLGRAILRLIESTEGKVIWLGQDITALAPAQMRAKRKELQIIFQDPLASLNPRMTIGDIIAEPLMSFYPRMSKTERRAKVADMMKKVGLLPQMINRYPHEFSGGQCQRIGIARAMILRPKLIICDEPVSSLDVSIRAQIINLLRDLQREFGMALIFISHDLSVIRHVSHRILVLYLGKIMELAEGPELARRPRHPYTQALWSAAPIPDPEIEKAKQHKLIRDDMPSPLKPPSGCVFRTRCPKAQEICSVDVPQLIDRNPGKKHFVACHFSD